MDVSLLASRSAWPTHPSEVKISVFRDLLGLSDSTTRRLLELPSQSLCLKAIEGSPALVDLSLWIRIGLPALMVEPLTQEEMKLSKEEKVLFEQDNGKLWKRNFHAVILGSKRFGDEAFLVPLGVFCSAAETGIRHWSKLCSDERVPHYRYRNHIWVSPKRLVSYFCEELYRLPYGLGA